MISPGVRRGYAVAGAVSRRATVSAVILLKLRPTRGGPSRGFDQDPKDETIGRMKQPAVSAECPKCGQERSQEDYEREELEQLLRAGAPIEAYCGSCDEHWVLSTEERADLARALKRA